jgi:hypothetical protein
MYSPVEVDGRSLVILKRRQKLFGQRFFVVASGQLEHDGETLELVCHDERRLVSDRDLASMMMVDPGTMIAACRGFDFFIIQDSPE